MTHQNHQTNGASLEDCHTNFFALTALCGIKWRKFLLGERPNASSDPLDDPVIRSYSRCLQADILCVWRRVEAPKQDPDPNNTISYDIVTSYTHPPLSLTAAKELWIFWYGEEPDLDGLVDPQLLKTSDSGLNSSHGAWESGLSYECRALLFKALHNRIERCLLSKDIVRLGKWFVQPCTSNDRLFGQSSQHLSFSFVFFVHGDTVCASIDLREHSAVHQLTPEYLAEAATASQDAASSSAPSSPKQVILAPFGISATLTGNSYRTIDPVTEKLFEDWCSFYPLCNKDNSELPPIVEVITDGCKMRYPSKYVLVTDIDESAKSSDSATNNAATTSSSASSSSPSVNSQSASQAIPIASKAITTATPTTAIPASGDTALSSKSPSDERNSSATSSILGKRSKRESKTLTNYETSCNNNFSNTINTHAVPSIATELPERVWQDCITNPIAALSLDASSGSAADTTASGVTVKCENDPSSAGGNNNNSSETKPLWEFVDPTQKATCVCAKSTAIPPGTPHGGASSYSRNSIGDSMPVPSVGSPGSAAPSPHPNSALSQPTSVPPADQLPPAISPRPPSSVPGALQQPGTPIDQLLDKNTPAPTPTDQHDNKSITASPYVQPTPSVEQPMSEPPQAMQTANTAPGSVPPPPSNGPVGGNTPSQIKMEITDEPPRIIGNPVSVGPATNSNSAVTADNAVGAESLDASVDMQKYLNLFNRPQLVTKDFETATEDDFGTPLIMLYDYTLLDAWFDHPVKRFKPNDVVSKQHKKQRGKNLYDSHTHSKPSMPTPSTLYSLSTDRQSMKREHDFLDDDVDSMLQPHEIKKEPNSDMSSAKDKLMTGRNFFTAEGLNPSMNDLDQLFDNSDDTSSNDEAVQVHTPPDSNKPANGCPNSIEEMKRSSLNNSNNNNNNSNSNNNNTGSIRPEDLTKMFPTPPSHEHQPNASPCGILDISMTDITENINIKQEIYRDMGNPIEESIEDWSYVYIPPTICKFVGSSNYDPLTNLPSQTLPPLAIPPNCVYKPSWLNQRQQQQQQQQQQAHHQELISQQQHQAQIQQQQQLIQPTTPLNNSTNPSTPAGLNSAEKQPLREAPATPTSNLLLNQLNCPPAALNAPGNNPMMQQMMRGMAPISPATGSPMMNTCRRPPYDIGGISSPATSTSSYLNKQFNSQEPETPCSVNPRRSPETNSLLVNVLLYDTALNVFRDHNFDSCTLCVCNDDTQKCVGNIRGADSGMYVALPGTSFNPSFSAGSGGASGGSGGSNSGQNSIRSISAFGGMDSPAPGAAGGAGGGGSATNNTANQHLTGYLDEDPIRCYCGFSAVVNRRLAYRSGLFYEDELEITGIAEDPSKYKQKSLLALLTNSSSSSAPTSSALVPVGADDDKKGDYQLAQTIMDLLRDQCSIIQTSSSSVHRALARHRKNPLLTYENVINILEFTDANDIVCLAIEQGRLALEMTPSESYRPPKSSISVHKWPYVQANGTRNNHDIVRVMKSMQPLLQNAFHTKSRPGQKDATYTVSGPLTWRQFHRLAGRASGQCEPQPIPSVIVGHEKDWLSVAPYAVHYWDKLLLEPYSYAKDVVYLVICPENEYVVSKTKTYFKELSTTYEMCKLGRHTPMKGWDGILTVGQNQKYPQPEGRSPLEEWFDTFEDRKLADQLRMYAHAFQHFLAPYLNRIPSDKSLLDPPESTSNNGLLKDRPMPSPMMTNSTPEPNVVDKAPNTPKTAENDQENRDSLNTSSSSPVTSLSDPLSMADDDINPPVIVLYVVEPFTSGSDSTDLQRIACLALLRCYSELLKSIPESIRSNVNIQLVALESIIELGRNRSRKRFSDEMKCLALSIFSQCKRYLAHTNTVKSLTGFGTAANMEIFLKSKDENNRQPYKMYTPPYILAPVHEKSDKTDLFRLRIADQQYSVMYCNYCISEDQSWLLATATDDRGELLEKVIINIDIPNRTRRKKAPARRLGLQKLMDFILGIISQTVQPWRLVIGRIGRIGHGELKSWSWLLSKQNLQKASKQLKDICKQCSLMYPHCVPSILSACLVTLEPDSKLRVMPDQFTPDERFSQISMQNPLSTPQDVTCTHILVFPISAVCQSFQKAFNELNETQVFENEDPFMFDFGEDPEDPMNAMNDVNELEDIFNWDQNMQQTGLDRNSNHGSPDRIEDNRSRQSPGINNFNSNRNNHDGQDAEEVGTVLQQPLAVGYFVSTAPTGRMPSWFWSSCPHLENVCPVFLKTALHLHVPGIQQNIDDPLAQSHSSANDHPLDSTLTAEVLRYVLEGYNVLSWLALDSNTHDRLSCLPIHVQVLMQLYHMTAAIA